ncbi:MAG: hypothetical protein LLG06_19245 [Desulfobacteraceae bacterium]|nr:hypothetical protein [Desulfobacteraceae bacterium]
MARNPESQGYVQRLEELTNSRVLSDEALLSAYQAYLLDLIGDVRDQLQDWSALRPLIAGSLTSNTVLQLSAGKPAPGQGEHSPEGKHLFKAVKTDRQ